MKDEFTGQEHKPTEGITIADLYDYEIAIVDRIGQALATKYATKPNTMHNLEEFVKEAHDKFLQEGFVVRVDTAKCLILGEPPEVTIVGKVPGHDDHKEGFDHEMKRSEVLQALDEGEKYLGKRKAWS